jgi:hypothetical protein
MTGLVFTIYGRRLKENPIIGKDIEGRSIRIFASV